MSGKGYRPELHPPTGDPIADLADALEAAAMPYVFTGATALNFWGRQRATEDIDIVVHGGRVRFARFLNRLQDAGFEVDPVRALKESTEEGHTAFAALLTVGEGEASIAVDLIRPALPFDRKVLSRAVRVPWFSRPGGIPIVSAEDLVIYKLIFFRQTEFSDDPRDIESVLARQNDLDTGYVLSTLLEIFKEDDERLTWFRKALQRHGFSP